MVRRFYRLVLPAVVVSLVWGGTLLYQRNRTQEMLQKSLFELRTGHPEEAIQLAGTLLEADSENAGANRVVAMAHRQLGHFELASEYFDKLPDGLASAHAARLLAVEETRQSGRWLRCVELLKKVLEVEPSNADAHRSLSEVFDASGLRWEAAPHHLNGLMELRFSIEELLLLGNPDEPLRNSELLKTAASVAPDDPLVQLGSAYQQQGAENPENAVGLLRKLLSESPKISGAHAMLGAALMDLGEFAAMPGWNEALPDNSAQSSEIWFVKGLWAQQTGQTEAAVRCFWETILRAPEKQRAHFHMGQALISLNRTEEAQQFLTRSEQLSELNDLMRPVYHRGAQPPLMKKIADRLEKIGRFWEAWGWMMALTRFAPGDADSIGAAVQLQTRLEADVTPQTIDAFNLARRFDFSKFPVPKWDIPASGFPDRTTPRSALTNFLQFRDMAEIVGIRFQYFNSDDPATEGKRMLETTGGGVAVLDFDCDSWPDVYLTQGAPWPAREGAESGYQDALYRNSGRQFFSECAAVAGTADTSFSQGISVGDFNNDGFPDIYLANIGQNRLFQNNGDGTFVDIEYVVEGSEELWTTSCMIADIDGDSLPDLFDANYLMGPDAYELICGTEHQRTCSPAAFLAPVQYFHRNLGDGTWHSLTKTVIGDTLHGKGLGLVAAKFSEGLPLDIFLANDGIANSCIQIVTDDTTGDILLEDVALRVGLAFDREGRAQACMGIAADDADGDGLLDLFVTNFYEESNTLYQQQVGGLFIDATRAAGLREPSLARLAFGTQFIDGNLDGLPDLVVANGHVDDFSYDGKAFHMPPQYFENSGKGQFREVQLTQPDSYFAGEYLGRGLARLDWNRDGREDFVVSHLDTPVALVSNESVSTGHSLSVQLIGVSCSRDAVGTVVTLESGQQRRVRQLTAGDGYQASNEKSLVFGLGDEKIVQRMTIQWRSGEVQSVENLSAGFEYRIVEGRAPVAFPLESGTPGDAR